MEVYFPMTNRDDFISAMRTVAHSVTLVTTDGPAGLHGATVSAFCSVSADPPMVLVCLNEGSEIFRTVTANKTFSVTVLPEGSQHLADRFAGRQDHELSSRFEGLEVIDAVPQVKGATVFNCEIANSIPSGTHHVLLGRVVSCSRGDQNPLNYYDGNYHWLSKFTQAAE